MEIQAKLHGREYKKPIQPLGARKEEREEFNKDAENLLRRLRQRHLEKKLKNGK